MPLKNVIKISKSVRILLLINSNQSAVKQWSVLFNSRVVKEAQWKIKKDNASMEIKQKATRVVCQAKKLK